MKALVTALTLLVISGPAVADEHEQTQRESARQVVQLSDEQMDGVVAGDYAYSSTTQVHTDGTTSSSPPKVEFIWGKTYFVPVL